MAWNGIYPSAEKVHAPDFSFVVYFKGLRWIRLSGDVFSQMNAQVCRVKESRDYLHDAEDNRAPPWKMCAHKQDAAPSRSR
jgi:hypothetical protein